MVDNVIMKSRIKIVIQLEKFFKEKKHSYDLIFQNSTIHSHIQNIKFSIFKSDLCIFMTVK